jgi:drug/metabolite transporter (DMT)-like permease
MDPNLASIGWGLVSAATWGAGDFSGGLASRRTNAFGVVVISQAVGLLLMLALAFALGEPMPGADSLGWGAASGLAGGIGITALYKALAMGQMGVAAPITAVLAAALPVLFAAITQGLPGVAQMVGFGLALAGIWFLSRSEASVGRPQGLGWALFAGLGIGGFLILISQVGSTGPFWPLAAARVASLLLILIVVAFSRAFKPVRGTWGLMLLAGVFDIGGNLFFLLAAQAGRLDIAAVVSSLYPASTVLLAWLLLKERMTRIRVVGVIFVLVAIVLIAAPRLWMPI